MYGVTVILLIPLNLFLSSGGPGTGPAPLENRVEAPGVNNSLLQDRLGNVIFF